VPVAFKGLCDDAAQPSREFLALQDVVDDDLDGPRLEDISGGIAEDGEKRQRERDPVGPDQIDQPQLRRSGSFADRSHACVRVS
jgi:hypothetical protein